MNEKRLFEETVSGQTLYDGAIISLQKDQVLLENGAKAFREVVRHPGGVCVVAMDEQDRLLMVRQFRYPYRQTLLEIPAGKLNYGEDPEECGRRELEEETGYQAEKLISLGKLYPSPGYCNEVIHLFRAQGLTPSKQHLDEDEFLEVLRIPFDEVVQMVLNGEIRDSKTQVAVLKTKLLENREKSRRN